MEAPGVSLKHGYKAAAAAVSFISDVWFMTAKFPRSNIDSLLLTSHRLWDIQTFEG